MVSGLCEVAADTPYTEQKSNHGNLLDYAILMALRNSFHGLRIELAIE
jgi:hypothetical protein